MDNKTATLIKQKGQGLLLQLIPPLVETAVELGIKNIGLSDVSYPDLCPTKEQLDKALRVRNQLVDVLNKTSKTIETLSKPLNVLNTVITTTSTALEVVDTAIIAAKIAIPLLPTPTPGVPNPGNLALVSLDTLNGLKKDTLTPKIELTKNTISNISIALDATNKVLVSIIQLLKSLDFLLLRCSTSENQLNTSEDQLIPFSDYLTKIEENQQQIQVLNDASNLSSIYKGFTLEIVEKQYSPTVKQVQAVAKNPQGIILLQTPLSFTTVPQVLIEELKLIIDSNNLKAN
jgi:hypothetical protein